MKSVLRFIRKRYIGRKRSLTSLWWSYLLGSLGTGSTITHPITIRDPENVYIGSRSSVNSGCVLNARDIITIGDRVMISTGVIINTGGLDYTKRGGERKRHTKAPVTLCDGVWIGSGAIINQGVTIGENSVIGAGSVVTKDIPANVVAVGAPARVIKNIEFQL